MDSATLAHTTVAEASTLIQSGELSSVELTAAVLARVEETEPHVHAYTALAPEHALDEAERLDAELAAGGHRGPLHGIPVAVKDLYLVAGMPTEAGSLTMQGYVAESDAEVVRRLRASGAIILGKTATTEFGYGQALPSARSPWDPTRYPGGSSVGSAVAVAVGSASAALGTDAGGSVRSPAAWNGIVGLKPTLGLTSMRGVISPGETLDHCGTLTRCVADAGIMLRVMSGDGVPVAQPKSEGQRSLSQRRFGIDRSFFYSASVQPRVARAIEPALHALEELGAQLVEVELADPEQIMATVMMLLAVDVSFAHQRWLRERGERYAPGTRLLLELGELFSAVDYLRAVQFRTDFKFRVRDVFVENGLDALVMSTSPMTAIPLDQLNVPLGGGSSALADRIKHVAPFNLTGQPAISIPCGLADDGLPVGLQLVGRPFADRNLLDMAAVYEQSQGWHTLRPPL